MAPFVHLHVHSHYSLLDGAAKISGLVNRAKELGMQSLALTDHGAMYGSIDFYETAKKAGIKPILGVEAYMAARTRFDRDHKLDSKSYHQLLLAETYEGYQNLIALVSEAHLNGFYYKPRIDKELLRKHSKGIIATSSCLGGEIPQRLKVSYEDGKKALEEYLDIFGPDHFFLELQHHPNEPEQIQLNEWLKTLAKEYKVGLICTNDVHYINPDDAEAQDVLVCVSSGKTVNDPTRLNMLDFNLSLASPEEMSEWFADVPEALENTVKIAERCNVEIPMGSNILPVYPLPEEELAKGTTDRLYLRKLCSEGIKRRYGFEYTCRSDRPEGEILPSPLNDPSLPLEQRVAERLEYELSVIEKMGYESYFLITQDFLNWARSQGIMIGPGRGSAAGSLASYLIGIINVDPLKYNLIFERFLNPERIGMPDIDNDIEDARRDEVLEYVRQRFGRDHVAQIITFGTMAARAAVRDVGRALGVSYKECDYLAKLIPSGPGGMSLKEALENIDELRQLYNSSGQIKNLVDIASKLEGVARHTSIHAAGVVITKEPLTRYVPLQRAVKDENAIVTQYAMHEVEDIGLLKIDFLGLSNLNIIQQALRVIRKTRQVEIDLDTLPTDNKDAYALLTRAETTGVFQLESAGMKRYLKELKPTQFEDIVSMVALYRPGPMDAIPDFIESKHGRKAITYLHPLLEPILRDTYGVIVTQDQVLEVARKFAGFSYGEADILRKAVGKKIKALLDEQREKFITGAVKANADQGVTTELATKVWDFVEPFARYGFNRAHAVCYAMIAYQTAYLKANYPVEFMASLLTSDINNLDRVGIEISECKEMGIEVLPPDVNESFVEFGAIFYPEQGPHRFDSYIRFGLGAIKNVGVHPAEFITEERKKGGRFTDLTDFILRCSPCLNKKVLENLAMAGALDSLAERNQVLSNLDGILTFMNRVSKEKASPQIGLFGDLEDSESLGSVNHTLVLQSAEPTPSRQRLAWERELLGIYVSEHPINPYRQFLPSDRTPLVELRDLDNNTPVKVCGIIMSVRKILTKNGQNMAFVGIEDETGVAEVVVFPKVWAASEATFTDGNAVYIEGKTSKRANRMDSDATDTSILIDAVSTLSEQQPVALRQGSRLTLRVPPAGDRELLLRLKECLERHEGRTPVTLLLPSLEGEQPMNLSQKVKVNDRLVGQLVNLLGYENVRM